MSALKINEKDLVRESKANKLWMRKVGQWIWIGDKNTIFQIDDLQYFTSVLQLLRTIFTTWIRIDKKFVKLQSYEAKVCLLFLSNLFLIIFLCILVCFWYVLVWFMVLFLV